MAQSNHHLRPGIPAGGEEPPERRTYRSVRQPHPDLLDLVDHSFGATSLPVTATDEARTVGTRVGVGQVRR